MVKKNFENFFSRFQDPFDIIMSDFWAKSRTGKTSFFGTAQPINERNDWDNPILNSLKSMNVLYVEHIKWTDFWHLKSFLQAESRQMEISSTCYMAL